MGLAKLVMGEAWMVEGLGEGTGLGVGVMCCIVSSVESLTGIFSPRSLFPAYRNHTYTRKVCRTARKIFLATHLFQNQ